MTGSWVSATCLICSMAGGGAVLGAGHSARLSLELTRDTAREPRTAHGAQSSLQRALVVNMT